ncbi:hypothetical protein BC629DRAFT_1302809 [Irpex lacteus]|nr:hypothetical protein BC629DRAFT_1302809 [Irpex lacteus]
MRLAAADIYADQLLLKGYGYPLWFPEPYPTDVDGEIFVGHVGHICRGSFHTLFNVRWSSSHSANPMGLPQGFEPLEFPPRLLWNPSAPVMDDGFICSESVKKSTGSAELNSIHRPTFKTLIRMLLREGGLLVVSGGGAQQEILLKNWLVPKYIFQHHSSWCRFARDVFGLDLTADEIIFVAGTVKASQWAVAAFMDRSVVQAASLQAGDGTHLSIGGSVSRSLRTSMSVEHRAGPRRIDEGATHSGSNGLPNQCLFVYRYKMRRRRKVSLWQKLYEEGGKLLDRKFQFSWRSDRFDDRSDNGPASGGSGSRGGSGGSGGSGSSDIQPSCESGGGTCPAPDDGLEIYGDDDSELDTDSNILLTDDSANTTVRLARNSELEIPY